MRKYVVISEEQDNLFIEATSFDLNNLVEINKKLYVPFFYNKEIVGIAPIEGLIGIGVLRWNIVAE